MMILVKIISCVECVYVCLFASMGIVDCTEKGFY